MARRACLLIFWAVAEPLAVSGFAPRAAGLDHRLRLAQQRDVAAFAAPPAAYADLFARFDKLDAKLQAAVTACSDPNALECTLEMQELIDSAQASDKPVSEASARVASLVAGFESKRGLPGGAAAAVAPAAPAAPSGGAAAVSAAGVSAASARVAALEAEFQTRRGLAAALAACAGGDDAEEECTVKMLDRIAATAEASLPPAAAKPAAAMTPSERVAALLADFESRRGLAMARDWSADVCDVEDPAAEENCSPDMLALISEMAVEGETSARYSPEMNEVISAAISSFGRAATSPND